MKMNASEFKAKCLALIDRVHDVRVCAAPAQVAGHKFSNLAVRTGMAFADTCDRGHDLTRSAIAALKSVTFNERRLNGGQFIALCQALDGSDLLPLSHDCERQTRQNSTPIEMHGTGTASASIAPLLRAS